MPPIGALRERVVIKSLAVTVSTASGEQTESWTDVVTVFASVRPLTGREAYTAQTVKASQPYEVSMRYRTDVTKKHRLSWDSKTLEIHAIANEGARDRFLVLQCTETS